MRSPGAGGSVLLSVADLTVRYGAIRALSGVSLDVEEGSSVAVLGANGAGKTTLIRAACGNLDAHAGRIHSGAVHFRGKRLTAVPAHRRVRLGIGCVPEGRQLFTSLTVHENLMSGLAGSRVGRRERSHRVSAMYDRFPALKGRRTWRAGLLSGGEQQMVALGRALVSQPTLLVLDEPTLGLAPVMIQQVASLIDEVRAAGTTVLLVEQNVEMALQHTDRAYILRGGRVALAGTAADIRGDSRIDELYLGGDAFDDEAEVAR